MRTSWLRRSTLALLATLASGGPVIGQQPPDNGGTGASAGQSHQGQAGKAEVLRRMLSDGGTEKAQGQPGQDPAAVHWQYNRGLWSSAGPAPAHWSTFTWISPANRNSGMLLAPADDAMRAHLDLAKNVGLIVTALEPNSAAALAGIRQNDVLIGIWDGKQSRWLGKPEDLEAALKAAGEQPVSLSLLRAGKKETIKVQPRVHASLAPVHPEPPSYWIGVSVAPVEPALRAQLQIPGKRGLLTVQVVEDSPAARAGIRPNDILLLYDGDELLDQTQLTRLVQERAEKTVNVQLVRQGKVEVVSLKPERRKTFTFTAEPRTGQFEILLPGGVVASPVAFPGNPFPSEFVIDSLAGGTAHQPPGAGGQPTPKAGASDESSTAKRLDDLSAQIKELRRAIEALARAQEKK